MQCVVRTMSVGVQKEWDVVAGHDVQGVGGDGGGSPFEQLCVQARALEVVEPPLQCAVHKHTRHGGGGRGHCVDINA